MEQIEREEHNYVIGWDVGPHGLCNGRAVINPEKTIRLGVDYSKPVTLERCRAILQTANEISGRNLGVIELRHSIYSKTPGNECGDFAETCYLDKTYRYDPKANSLTIFDRGECVYSNENGQILRGDDAHVAYCDGLDV
jgi:hypothetical protein